MTQITIQPTPECAGFEELLPLLDTDALTAEEISRTQLHLAGCAWCQAQRAGYDTFEAALRRHYGSDVSDGSSITLEGIMRADGMVNEEETATDDESQFVLEVSPIAPPVRRAPRRRWRLAEIAAVLVVGLLAAALLVNRIGILGGNPPPLKSAAGAVVFTHSVLWGKLQINGRTVKVTTDGHDPLYLPRGQNTLTYLAPPLPTLTCTISAPAAHDDTCPLYSAQEVDASVPTFPGRVIDLKATPDRLPASQRDALMSTIQQQFDTLDATMTIQPGDHYSTPEGRFLTSDRTFTMTLKYHVAADGLGQVIYGCLPFCENVPVDVWTIIPTFSWEYVDQYGKPETVLQGPAGTGGQSDITMGMTLQWDGSWHVTLPDGTGSSSLCSLATDVLMSYALNNGSQGGFSTGCGGNPVDTPVDTYVGTLFDMSLSGNNGGSEKTGRVLYRGGALIAADSIAHDLAPWMPIASAHEQAIVRQLLGLNS